MCLQSIVESTFFLLLMEALKWRSPVEKKNGIKRMSQIRDIPSDFDGSFKFALLDIDRPVFTAVL